MRSNNQQVRYSFLTALAIGRIDYTAIGNDINPASRLCDHAEDGQIPISQKAYLEIEGSVEGREVTGLELKGVNRSLRVYAITRPT